MKNVKNVFRLFHVKNVMDNTTDLYKVPDAVPPIHAVSSHVASDKGSSVKVMILKQSTFSAPNWLSLIRSGAEPHDSYNHADSSWKFQEIQRPLF